MRSSAMIIAIVGGILGIMAGMMQMAVGDLAIGPGAQQPAFGVAVADGLLAQLFATMAIVGALLSPRLPRIAPVLLAVAGVGGFLFTGSYWLAAGAFCLVAAALQLVSLRRGQAGADRSTPAGS